MDSPVSSVYEFALEEAGGGALRYVPALNARDDHVGFMAELIEQHTAEWRKP